MNIETILNRIMYGGIFLLALGLLVFSVWAIAREIGWQFFYIIPGAIVCYGVGYIVEKLD